MMNVNEFDIFNFVFNPERLDNQTFDFIKNSNDFKSVIEFYEGLKNDLNTEVSTEQKLLLKSKIPSYSKNIRINLKKINENKINYQIAADSIQLKKRFVDTFVDESKFIIVRLIYENENLVVYPLFTQYMGDKKFILKFFPSEKEILVTGETISFSMPANTIIERIELISL